MTTPSNRTTPFPHPNPAGIDGYGQAQDASVDSLWHDAIRSYLASVDTATLNDLLPTGAGLTNAQRHDPDFASMDPTTRVNAVSDSISGKALQLNDLRARTDANGYILPDTAPTGVDGTPTTPQP